MTTARPVLVLTALLALTGTVAAQPGETPPVPAPAASPAGVPGAPAGAARYPRPAKAAAKSEDKALALSITTTLAGYGVMLATSALADDLGDSTTTALGLLGGFGVMFGPSTGHWYGGAVATRGMGLRVAAVATAMVAAAVAISDCPLFANEPCDPTTSALLLTGAMGMFVGGTLDDIITAPRRIRKHNQALEVGLAPMVTQRSMGFAVGGRF